MQQAAYEYAGVRDMNITRTAAYHPPTMYKPSFMQMGLPPFTLETVEWMRRDPQVRLGMSIKLAPFHVVKLTIKGDPNVAQFMGNMIRRFWMKAVPKILRAFWYTRSGGEIVYKLQNGRQEFWNYFDVYPSDVSVLCKGQVPCGVSIRPQGSNNDQFTSNLLSTSIDNPNTNYQQFKPLRMFFPKGFLYLHNREFGSFKGQSEFEASYEAWMEKSDSQGGKHSRKLWFYKNAFSGGILFHPPGTYRDENNNEIPYQALARQALETSLNGSVWTFEQKFDTASGQPLWSYIEPKLNGGGKELLDYVRNLDNEIMRGLGIPDDIVQQVSGTGSYAGRSIPMMGFFISQRTTLTSLFAICDEQVFRPLCRSNFGHDNYEAMMEIDIERLMGAMDGQPNQPHPNEAAFENPHANPQGLPGQGQQPSGNKTSQFSNIPEIPVIATPIGSSSLIQPQAGLISSFFNGVWDSSVNVIANPINRSTVYQFGAQQVPAGQSHGNRSGKTSTGGQFTDGPGVDNNPESGSDSEKKKN